MQLFLLRLSPKPMELGALVSCLAKPNHVLHDDDDHDDESLIMMSCSSVPTGRNLAVVIAMLTSAPNDGQFHCNLRSIETGFSSLTMKTANKNPHCVKIRCDTLSAVVIR